MTDDPAEPSLKDERPRTHHISALQADTALRPITLQRLRAKLLRHASRLQLIPEDMTIRHLRSLNIATVFGGTMLLPSHSIVVARESRGLSRMCASSSPEKEDDGCGDDCYCQKADTDADACLGAGAEAAMATSCWGGSYCGDGRRG